ncbi:hypothetical protein LCGC14_2181870 [marine sediment metagenome]|uniref:Uncharacterized protein n=1 Tax=marine sediment metagenome TaxID=412755 RepID=A0A0F9E9B2_9ZZZZ
MMEIIAALCDSEVSIPFGQMWSPVPGARRYFISSEWMVLSMWVLGR